MSARDATPVWLMETAYQRRTTIPRAWHAFVGHHGTGAATALCGAAILGAQSAHREASLATLEASHRTARWKRVCSRCRALVAA